MCFDVHSVMVSAVVGDALDCPLYTYIRRWERCCVAKLPLLHPFHEGSTLSVTGCHRHSLLAAYLPASWKIERHQVLGIVLILSVGVGMKG